MHQDRQDLEGTAVLGGRQAVKALHRLRIRRHRRQPRSCPCHVPEVLVRNGQGERSYGQGRLHNHGAASRPRGKADDDQDHRVQQPYGIRGREVPSRGASTRGLKGRDIGRKGTRGRREGDRRCRADRDHSCRRDDHRECRRPGRRRQDDDGYPCHFPP